MLLNYTTREGNSQEIREIENWEFVSYPSICNTYSVWILKGIVTKVNDKKLDFIRITNTSPIKDWDPKTKTITTCSGSQYILGKPSENQMTWWKENNLDPGTVPNWVTNSNWINKIHWKDI